MCKINRETFLSLASTSILPCHPSRLQLDWNLGYHGTQRTLTRYFRRVSGAAVRYLRLTRAVSFHPPSQSTVHRAGAAKAR